MLWGNRDSRYPQVVFDIGGVLGYTPTMEVVNNLSLNILLATAVGTTSIVLAVVNRVFKKKHA